MEGTGIVVRDDRSLCVPAGFCGNRVTNVWSMLGGSGTDDTTVRAQVIAMVERCPSGAPTHRVDQRSGMPISRLEPSMPPSTRMSRPVTYEPASDDR